MIVPDANVLIYAHDSTAPAHHKARMWWEAALSGHEPVGIPWIEPARLERANVMRIKNRVSPRLRVKVGPLCPVNEFRIPAIICPCLKLQRHFPTASRVIQSGSRTPG